MKKGTFEFELENFTGFSIQNWSLISVIPLIVVHNLIGQETVLAEDPLCIQFDHFRLKFR